jgi:hypothetical protein
MVAPTHSVPGGLPCKVMTETAIHTVTLPEGSFAAIVSSTKESEYGMITILDRDEVENHIRLLRNAMEDAELLDAGKPVKNAPAEQRPPFEAWATSKFAEGDLVEIKERDGKEWVAKVGSIVFDAALSELGPRMPVRAASAEQRKEWGA